MISMKVHALVGHHWLRAMLAVIGLAAVAGATTPSEGELREASRWVAARIEASTKPVEPLPFSFVYGGRPSAELLRDWKASRHRRECDRRRIEHTVVYADPATGFEVRCVAFEYLDFPTVEWTLHFRNRGQADTPMLEDIRPLDLNLGPPDGGGFVLHHTRGDDCAPDSYEPCALTLTSPSEHRFSSVGGRPTNRGFPYFNLEWPGAGLIAVLGWPGQWTAGFMRDESGCLRVRAGQESTRFRLSQGDEVRSPLVVLQFWKGDRVRAQNLWRRWMLAHNLPRDPRGTLPPPMLTSCSGGFFPGLRCNEADERRFIDAFAEAGILLDSWWMDAGWYPCGAGWPAVGTWSPDPTRFPRGLRAVSDHARSKGLGLIVWFEPERVTPGTWLDTNHPEWLLGPDGQTKLLNLGDARARAWLTDHVSGLIRTEGISLYRQDFNIDPLPYWRAHDGADRQGLTEIRHVTGYLAYWDELRRRHPGLLIDSCASGGRRNDLETLRRAVPLLRSDYQSFEGDPAFAPGNQGHTYGLAPWIPYFGQGVYYHERQFAYSVRSSWSPAFGMCVDIRKPGVNWPAIRRLAQQWRQIASCYLGDFYPLTEYQLDPTAWLAWQFDVPERGEGLVQVFRRDRSFYETARFKLGALEPDVRYLVTNLDSGERTARTGRELAETGLLVAIADRPGDAVLTYSKLNE